MANLVWYPAFLTEDEYLPEGRDSPEAWLPHLLSGGDDAVSFQAFNPGDVVGFRSVENLGTIEVMINPDGTLGSGIPRCPETPDMFPGTHSPLPQTEEPEVAANCFWDHESETFAETLETFAEMYAEMMDGEPETVCIETAHWSDSIKYRISDDGKSLTLETQSTTASAQETSSC